jgi:hypothetical protein
MNNWRERNCKFEYRNNGQRQNQLVKHMEVYGVSLCSARITEALLIL